MTSASPGHPPAGAPEADQLEADMLETSAPKIGRASCRERV